MPKSLFTKRYTIFREHLQQARIDAGLSQEELAKKMGWDQTFVSKIERGVRRVDVVELIGICDALGLDPAEFVKDLHRRFGRT
jgi:transcriptional regulator with XRE-family HTH domain